MRWMILTVALLGAAASLSACGPDTCLPGCEATREYDAIAYDLRARLDWGERELRAREAITVILGGGRVIELDARVDIDEVTVDGEDLGYDHDEERGLLRVDLGPVAPEPAAGAEVTFTIGYRARASAGLVFAGPRDDDPLTARVAYTNSEPDRGRSWLVSNDHPADRARFSVELELPAGEDAIANGERVDERDEGGRRFVRYAIEQPLPTYLMAFAAGELEHTEDRAGRVPLALWHRRGLPVDAAAHLAINARHVAHFEALLGPYPFSRYATVLLPGFPGGMENATITFNSETSGLGAINEVLNAHELGHQWFGDWVTMRDYRDVWIKEGMATLLAAEASRPLRDAAGGGRLFGASFNFSRGDKIVDDELSGLARYTSGPYERAAWMLTQVRARVGEAAFWATLREILAAHALDSVDSDAFVRAFAPELDGAGIAQWLSALGADGAPAIAIGVSVGAPGAQVMLSLSDPKGLLLEPIPVAVVDAAGAASPRQLAPGAPLAVTVPAGGYLAPDERDAHPYWTASFQVDGGAHALLAPLLAPDPAAAGALAAFGARSAGTQERALTLADLSGLAPGELPAVHAALDSNQAQRTLVLDACRAAAALPSGNPAVAAWAAALGPLLSAPAAPGFQAAFGACARVQPAELRGELAALAALGPAIPASRLARLEYLLGFDYGAADTLALVARIAAEAPTVRHRDLALDRLGQQVRLPYAGVPAASLEAYRAFFRGRLPATTSGTRLVILWRGIVGLAALDALPDVAALLHEVPLDPATERRIVCEAFGAAGGSADAPAWRAFQDAAEPWDELSDDAAEALGDPGACGG